MSLPTGATGEMQPIGPRGRRRLAMPSRPAARAERLIVPPIAPHSDGSPDDYRRVVLAVAALAVGFFIPSLPLAGVPSASWPAFALAALLAGTSIAASVQVRARTSTAVALALANGVVVTVLGMLYRDSYHQIGLLFGLVVTAYAVIQGLTAALALVALGSVAIPFAIERGPNNATDLPYAAIYLLGLALVPWVAGRLAARRAEALNGQLAATVATEREAVRILARAAEAKDQVTGDHVTRVGELAAALADLAGLDAPIVEDIRFAGMLHDVGKLHVPDHILTKPARLSSDEMAIVRRHTISGERILGTSAAFELARRIARSHHENWDGSGYPDALRGEEIPVAARIVHIVDVFDALRSDRPYKRGWSLARCLAELERQGGRMFDPALVGLFLELISAQRVGTQPGLVLADGDLTATDLSLSA